MDLKEKLNKFWGQQEKCQSALAAVAAEAASLKARPTASAAAQKLPVPLKFSNDTERLQYINSIRKSPAGAQIKRVLDLLREVARKGVHQQLAKERAISAVRAKWDVGEKQIGEYWQWGVKKTRQVLTPEQINESCYVDIKANKIIFDSLRKNIKVNYDGKWFSYKSKHEIKSKHELLVLIRKAPEGIAISDLKDAYPFVMEDLQELKAVGEVWLLSNLECQEDTVYPNDPRVVMKKVDDDIKQLFRGIDLPRDMIDIEKDLLKNGMRPATNTAERKKVAQVQGIKPRQKQKKKREFSKRAKLTNVHLPELFKFNVPGM